MNPIQGILTYAIRGYHRALGTTDNNQRVPDRESTPPAVKIKSSPSSTPPQSFTSLDSENTPERDPERIGTSSRTAILISDDDDDDDDDDVSIAVLLRRYKTSKKEKQKFKEIIRHDNWESLDMDRKVVVVVGRKRRRSPEKKEIGARGKKEEEKKKKKKKKRRHGRGRLETPDPDRFTGWKSRSKSKPREEKTPRTTPVSRERGSTAVTRGEWRSRGRGGNAASIRSESESPVRRSKPSSTSRSLSRRDGGPGYIAKVDGGQLQPSRPMTRPPKPRNIPRVSIPKRGERQRRRIPERVEEGEEEEEVQAQILRDYDSEKEEEEQVPVSGPASVSNDEAQIQEEDIPQGHIQEQEEEEYYDSESEQVQDQAETEDEVQPPPSEEDETQPSGEDETEVLIQQETAPNPHTSPSPAREIQLVPQPLQWAYSIKCLENATLTLYETAAEKSSQALTIKTFASRTKANEYLEKNTSPSSSSSSSSTSKLTIDNIVSRSTTLLLPDRLLSVDLHLDNGSHFEMWVERTLTNLNKQKHEMRRQTQWRNLREPRPVFRHWVVLCDLIRYNRSPFPSPSSSSFPSNNEDENENGEREGEAEVEVELEIEKLAPTTFTVRELANEYAGKVFLRKTLVPEPFRDEGDVFWWEGNAVVEHRRAKERAATTTRSKRKKSDSDSDGGEEEGDEEEEEEEEGGLYEIALKSYDMNSRLGWDQIVVLVREVDDVTGPVNF
ncbi:hypothetical protein GGS20DRAFT_47185 [Poronia punctata]|nr:hypothetical protein GGS20DRAFT_47185 [Poronia punctata]